MENPNAQFFSKVLSAESEFVSFPAFVHDLSYSPWVYSEAAMHQRCFIGRSEAVTERFWVFEDALDRGVNGKLNTVFALGTLVASASLFVRFLLRQRYGISTLQPSISVPLTIPI